MANKLQTYVQLAGETADSLTKTHENWTGFLATASRLYRYQFPDQLLIHAQRPDATACAGFDVWNRRMRRYIRRGSKGIALVDVRGGRPILRYVFDVADTRTEGGSRGLYLWEYKPEYRDTVAEALEDAYGIPGDGRAEEQLAHIASKIAKDFWENHHPDIRSEISGSPLEKLDESSLRVTFCKTVATSIAYILLSRCGLHPEKYFKLDNFDGILSFNTQRTIKVLGAAVNQAGDVLHRIAVAIMDYERGKQPAQPHEGSAPEAVPEKSLPAASSDSGGEEGSHRPQPSISEIYGQYKPVIKEFLMNDTAYRNACKNSDHENAELEGIAAIRRAALEIEDLRFMKAFYDMQTFHSQMQREVLAETYPLLSMEQEPESEDAPADVTDCDNPGRTDVEQADEVAEGQREAETDTMCPDPEPTEQTQPFAEYQIGDTVYLEDILYEITDIGLFDVQLLDPSLSYPVFRSENKERLADMLRSDPRNVKKGLPGAEKPDTAKQEIILDASKVREISSEAVGNFHITDGQLGTGGPKEKFRMNMEAIATLKRIEAEDRAATSEEQGILSRYAGWGGIPDAFDHGKSNWKEECKELEAALTPEEYGSARASTLNAHYTSPAVIRAIYAVVENMGFKAGNILEPSCGIGNFFGLLPEGMSKSRLYGVELDSISGRIARQLYPDASIQITGFEKAQLADSFFDLAIGNVPFGQYQANDPAYNRLGFSLHNYFLAKSLDLVRPGGILAFVTSRYTMDAKSMDVRKYLAGKAELLGAIRLPNNAFKENAGTDVVSDILFLQKRDTPALEEPAWVHASENEDGFIVSSYFLAHPEMVLGIQTSESTRYGMDYTVLPLPDADLPGQLQEAVAHIHGCYRETAVTEAGEHPATSDTLPADPAVKNYTFTVVKGDIYYRENSVMVKSNLAAAAKSRVRSLIQLRDCAHALIRLQMDEDTPDSAIAEKQRELNLLYDTFTRKYGLINSRANRLAFDRDSSYYLLCSLEILDDDGNLQRKADMFTKRTIKQHRTVTSVDTASEALTVSIGERARVDLPFMAQLSGKTEEGLIRELRGVIYKDPVKDTWQTADEYLSGNVRRKLRQAKRAAEQDPDYQANVDALTAAQPKDLDASEIEVRLGATWIDKSYIQQFMSETLNTPSISGIQSPSTIRRIRRNGSSREKPASRTTTWRPTPPMERNGQTPTGFSRIP